MDFQKLGQEINLLHNRVCYALADPKRILILYFLSEGRHCVSDIAEALSLPQSTVSRHLRVLRERELVNTEREGTTVYYALADGRVIEALELLRGILITQLAAGLSLTHPLKPDEKEDSL